MLETKHMSGIQENCFPRDNLINAQRKKSEKKMLLTYSFVPVTGIAFYVSASQQYLIQRAE